MKALLIPFGYPGYPQKELHEKIDFSKVYLKKIGLDVVSTDSIIKLEDCERAVQIAVESDYAFSIILIASWVEVPNVMNVISAAQLDKLPILLWSHDNVYSTQNKELISFGSVAAAAVLRESFEEFGFKFKFVIGNDFDEKLTEKILNFGRAAKAIKKLRNTRIGLLGYASMGMYTGLGDHLKVKRIFGTEIVQLDQYTLVNRASRIAVARIEEYKKTFREEWNLSQTINDEDMNKTISFYLALKDLASEHKLDGLTVKCQYELSIEFGFTPCVALSILGGEMQVSCEGDVYMLLTQMIMGYVSGDVTTYGDVLGTDDNSIISAACGFAPKCFLNSARPNISKHTALYSGLLVTSGIKSEMPATVGRIANLKDGFKMHVLKGKTEELKDFHEIDCPPYPGTKIKLLNKEADTFTNELMSQHYVMVFGNYWEALMEFCDLKDIKVI